MSTDAPAALQSAATEPEDRSIDSRDERALTEYLTVLEDVGRAAGADDLYLVVSQSGSEYLVDARGGSCECPDHQHRDVRCKHVRRVAFATGERAVPAGICLDTIDEQLGDHVSGCPRFVVPDGGTDIKAEKHAEDEDERPGDCDCIEALGDLPCWPCYRDGFEEPNPERGDGE